MSIIPYNTGNFPIYRFYIDTTPTCTTEVFPLNFNETSLVDELEDNEVFYRRKFSGNLLFGTNSIAIDASGTEQNRMDDFALLWAYETSDPCQVLYLTITKELSGVVSTYWEGYFSTTDGTFDIDKCSFEVNPLVYDAYFDILNNVEKQYNVIATGAVTHNITTHAVRGTISVTYDRNMWLTDVIDYLASNATVGISPGCAVSSDFFTAATNPATTDDNELLLITIAAKSDIVKPSATEPVKSIMLSWKELMDILWGMFQVKWNYDIDTDTINVEHISWFTALGSLDVTDQPLMVSTNKYSYLKNKMPKYEFFEFQEADEISFIGTYIYYPDACIDGNSVTNRTTLKLNVTTDLEYIFETAAFDPELLNPDGFVLLCNYLYSPGVYRVVISAGLIYPYNARLNMPLSWASLHDKYYRHNRSAIEGFINGSLVTFYSAKKTKKQECSIILCDEFDPENSIETELGDVYFAGQEAIVGKAEIRPSGLINLNLLYGPPDNAIPAPVVPKIASFFQIGTSSVEVYLSQPSDAEYSMHIWEEIYDDVCALHCSEGQPNDPEAFVIHIGETYVKYDFLDICPGFIAGYTFWVQIDDTAMLANGWTVNFERDNDYIVPGCP